VISKSRDAANAMSIESPIVIIRIAISLLLVGASAAAAGCGSSGSHIAKTVAGTRQPSNLAAKSAEASDPSHPCEFLTQSEVDTIAGRTDMVFQEEGTPSPGAKECQYDQPHSQHQLFVIVGLLLAPSASYFPQIEHTQEAGLATAEKSSEAEEQFRRVNTLGVPAFLTSSLPSPEGMPQANLWFVAHGMLATLITVDVDLSTRLFTTLNSVAKRVLATG
jgi:hypothetical protein